MTLFLEFFFFRFQGQVVCLFVHTVWLKIGVVGVNKPCGLDGPIGLDELKVYNFSRNLRLGV